MGNRLFIPQFFCRAILSLIFILLLYYTNLSTAFSETNFSANRYYSDGIQLSQANKWEQAVKEFQKAIKTNPKHKLAFANLGVAFNQIGNHKNALLAFDEAIRLGYTHAHLRYNRALSFSKLDLMNQRK